MREVGAGDEAEVFIAGERWDLREAAAGEKDGGGTEDEMQVLGVRNEGQKGEQGERCASTRGRARSGSVSATKKEAR